jgi:hypothetical protein
MYFTCLPGSICSKSVGGCTGYIEIEKGIALGYLVIHRRHGIFRIGRINEHSYVHINVHKAGNIV